MKNIGIFTNESKDKQLKVTKLLVDKLLNTGAFVMLPENKAGLINHESLGFNEKDILKSSEVIISIGGDGTFLGIARKVCCLDIPILGVNVGNLGFLAEVDRMDIDKVVNCLMSEDYRIENRMVLEAKVFSDDYESETYYALNDAVVSRGIISRVINIKTIVDGVTVDQFPADGIIISTPTGSTAYSLSAGGPIVEPDMDLMIITPICPHILRARSIVVSSKKNVTIIIEDKNQEEAMLTIDGQENNTLTNIHKVKIKKSDKLLKVIKLSDRNFFDVVRDKLFSNRR